MVKLNNTLINLLLGCVAIAQVLAQDSEVVATDAVSIENLNEEHCGQERSGCCSEMFLGDNENLIKCFAIHSMKLPPDGDVDMSKSFKFLSCFVECLYKQRKYIGKSDTINMKMVKLDAEQMYADRPKEKEYHIRQFEFCRKDALNVYGMVKASPGAKSLLKNACRPYLLMVYLCQSEYHSKHECPYFRWEGITKAGTKQICKDARAKCYEIDGIAAPKDL